MWKEKNLISQKMIPSEIAKIKKSEINWKRRCDAFFKKSNFKIILKSKKGIKKIKIVFTYLFLIIDKVNNRDKLIFAIPKMQEIADFVGCHLSWVKQVKKMYFSNSSSKFSSDEKIAFERIFQARKYQEFFGWKNFYWNDYEDEIEYKESKNPFLTEKKIYLNFRFNKAKNKTSCFKKYYSFCKFDFDNKFINKITSKKTKKVKKNFIKKLFEPNYWSSESWLWKTILFLKENLILTKRCKNTNWIVA